MSTPFSKRHGYTRQKIIARESAPKQLRSDILFAIHELGDPGGANLYGLCGWLEPILKRSLDSLFSSKFEKVLMECPWFRFYDCVEGTSRFFTERSLNFSPRAEEAKRFEEQVNSALEENGVGWKLVEGQLQIRGDEGFEKSFQSALDNLEARGLSVAHSEMREALNDLSRRPKADATAQCSTPWRRWRPPPASGPGTEGLHWEN